MNTLPTGADDLFEDSLGDSAPSINPLMLVHRALRGRYIWAGLLGVVLAVPMGIIGYIAIPPEYTSRAVLEAKMSLPKVMYEMDLNESMPAFEAFVSQQASELWSERVLSSAIDDPELKKEGWPAAPEGLIRLRRSIDVDTPKRANQIILYVHDTNPKAAQAAARAILKSYTTIREGKEDQMFGERKRKLQGLREKYLRERTEKRQRALNLALDAAGTEDIQKVQLIKLDQVSDIEDQVRELTTLISLMKSDDEPETSDEEQSEAEDEGNAEGKSETGGETGEKPSDEDADLAVDPRQFEGEDDKLDRLVNDRDLLKRQLDALLLNATTEHRQAKRLVREIQVLEAEVANRAEELDEIASGKSGLSPGGSSLKEIETRLADLERQRIKTKNDLEKISQIRLEVFALKQEAELADSRLEDAEIRIESLTVEIKERTKGRIQVAQQPERPLEPSTDRRIPLAGAGFVGGLGLGVGLVTAMGFAFPRVRVADDVLTGRGDIAMLGMIPEFLDDGSSDAALNVRESFHFLRVILDARTAQGALVCGITSPTSGDGKTTIAIRLAQSYAAARRRVLLVDADLVGRGATRSIGLTRKPGIDAEHTSIDDVVVPLEDLGFDMIPASDSESASENFCGQTLRDLIDSARERYDIILIDSGPILGSIEAAAMTPMMDQILLVISRGLESRLLRMATDRLRELNAKSVGIIFNRATTVDFNRSFAPPSSTSRRSSQRGLTTAAFAVARESMSFHGDQDSER